MGKVTVNHYLNKDLSPVQKDNQWRYPVYVQVIALRKNLRFKSNNGFFAYLSDEDLKYPEILSLLEREKQLIENIVSDLINKNLEDDITSKNLNLYSQNLDDMIENNFSKLLSIESKKYDKFIPNLFLNSSYSDINEIICFFNESSPLINISEEISLCLSAVDAIKDEIKFKLFCIYDLFGGERHKQIKFLIDSYTAYDEKHTNELLGSLQNLALL